jgi:hypothetical protein
MCNKEIAKETHHLSPQKDADLDGFIGSFHKNHSANLASVCDACHDNIHKNDIKLVKKKTSKGTKILKEYKSFLTAHTATLNISCLHLFGLYS